MGCSTTAQSAAAMPGALPSGQANEQPDSPPQAPCPTVEHLRTAASPQSPAVAAQPSARAGQHACARSGFAHGKTPRWQRVQPHAGPRRMPWGILVCLAAGMAACSSTNESAKQKAAAQAKHDVAIRMWQERCKLAGEKIYKTVENVEGVFLMKIRTFKDGDYDDQFKLSDPYGSDVFNEGYIHSFLKGSNIGGLSAGQDLSTFKKGYLYVEAEYPTPGIRYRYTGRIEEPWQRDKKYLKGYTRFVTDATPASGPKPRYGVTFDDISTPIEREHWIAGSSLRVIDLSTGEVIAERIGYMVDWAQGSRAGGRAPWLLAANNACPAFPVFRGERASSAQSRQTYRFVEKVLKPMSK